MSKILSIHWKFTLGGVAKYAAMLEDVKEYLDVQIRSLCILPQGVKVDEDSMAKLDATIIPLRSVFDTSWIAKVRAIVRKEQPDCILSHGFNGHLVSLLATAGMGSARRLATYHGSYHATTLARRLVEPVYNGFTHWYLRRHADGILSVAGYCADFLETRGVARSKITVVHNGIDDRQPEAGAREAIRGEWGVLEDEILIGVASRLDPVKGLDYLLRAFAGVAPEFPKARLVVMGDGTQGAELRGLASHLNIGERVSFVGRRNDVPRCLEALDIFALPSLAEYHSIGLLEAMRAGLPIIATDVGGNTESVRHEQEGLVVPPADADALAQELRRLLGDENLRSRLGKAARERFKAEFTQEVMLSRTASWLQQFCECR